VPLDEGGPGQGAAQHRDHALAEGSPHGVHVLGGRPVERHRRQLRLQVDPGLEQVERVGAGIVEPQVHVVRILIFWV